MVIAAEKRIWGIVDEVDVCLRDLAFAGMT